MAHLTSFGGVLGPQTAFDDDLGSALVLPEGAGQDEYAAMHESGVAVERARKCGSDVSASDSGGEPGFGAPRVPAPRRVRTVGERAPPAPLQRHALRLRGVMDLGGSVHQCRSAGSGSPGDRIARLTMPLSRREPAPCRRAPCQPRHWVLAPLVR